MNRRPWLLYTAFGLEILLLFLAGDAPGLLPAVCGVVPSLLIPASVSIALTVTDVLPAMVFGVVCGLLSDFSRGGPYGPSAMVLAVLCYAIALLRCSVLQKNLLTALLLTAPAIILAVLFQWLFFYVGAGYSGAVYALIFRYLPMAGYTFAAAVPIYFATRGLAVLCRSNHRKRRRR